MATTSEDNIDFTSPLVEKYRPKEIKDIVGNIEAVKRLEAFARDGNMVNLILAGPPGTGKTTSILALARALLGPAFKDAVLELNASDDRGVDIVRNRIKMFAQKKVSLPPGRHKIIILDEADSMTDGAQQALRRTMEIYSSSTRFALACNTSSKIIEPIQSRCAIVRYTRLEDDQIAKRLLYVIREEKIDYAQDGLEALLFTADGDMRQALNNLQSTWAGFGRVDAVNVLKVCDTPHPLVVKEIVASCLAQNIDQAQENLNKLWYQGYSAADIVQTIFRIIKNYEMSEPIKLDFLKEVAFTHMRITDGVSTLLQLSGLLARICALPRT